MRTKREITIRYRAGRARPHLVCWRDPAGKKQAAGFATLAEAEELRARMLAALAAKEAAEVRAREAALEYERSVQAGGDGPTLEAFRPEWERKYTTGLKTSTRDFYRYLLDDYLIPMLGSTRIGEEALTRGTVLELIAALQAKRSKRATVTAVLRTLSTVLSAAVDLGLRKSNPCFRMGKRLRAKGEAEGPQPNPMSKAEAEAFLEAVAEKFPEWHVYFLAALRTGLRVGELAALKWTDVDLARKVAIVRGNFSPRDGEDIDPKSRKTRAVDISPQLARALEASRAAQRKTSFAGGRGARLGYVFLTPDGGQVRQDGKMRAIFDRALAAASLTARAFTPHDLRDSFATLHLQAGTTVEYIAAQLGHADVSTTLRRYIKYAPNDRSRLYSAALDDLGAGEKAEAK